MHEKKRPGFFPHATTLARVALALLKNSPSTHDPQRAGASSAIRTVFYANSERDSTAQRSKSVGSL
jgi:hypothetical protein